MILFPSYIFRCDNLLHCWQGTDIKSQRGNLNRVLHDYRCCSVINSLAELRYLKQQSPIIPRLCRGPMHYLKQNAKRSQALIVENTVFLFAHS